MLWVQHGADVKGGRRCAGIFLYCSRQLRWQWTRQCAAVDRAYRRVIVELVAQRGARQHIDVCAPGFHTKTRAWVNRRSVDAGRIELSTLETQAAVEGEPAQINRVHYVTSSDAFHQIEIRWVRPVCGRLRGVYRKTTGISMEVTIDAIPAAKRAKRVRAIVIRSRVKLREKHAHR